MKIAAYKFGVTVNAKDNLEIIKRTIIRACEKGI